MKAQSGGGSGVSPNQGTSIKVIGGSAYGARPSAAGNKLDAQRPAPSPVSKDGNPFTTPAADKGKPKSVAPQGKPTSVADSENLGAIGAGGDDNAGEMGLKTSVPTWAQGRPGLAGGIGSVGNTGSTSEPFDAGGSRAPEPSAPPPRDLGKAQGPLTQKTGSF
jgi:hypothetical protein